MCLHHSQNSKGSQSFQWGSGSVMVGTAVSGTLQFLLWKSSPPCFRVFGQDLQSPRPVPENPGFPESAFQRLKNFILDPPEMPPKRQSIKNRPKRPQKSFEMSPNSTIQAIESTFGGLLLGAQDGIFQTSTFTLWKSRILGSVWGAGDCKARGQYQGAPQQFLPPPIPSPPVWEGKACVASLVPRYLLSPMLTLPHHGSLSLRENSLN